LNPQYKNGKWTSLEDKNLKKYVNNFGESWTFISKCIKNRSAKQIRNRYDDYLRPNLKKGNFNEEEDKNIKNLYKCYKNKWSKYLFYIPYRSKKDIKNRAKSIMNI